MSTAEERRSAHPLLVYVVAAGLAGATGVGGARMAAPEVPNVGALEARILTNERRLDVLERGDRERIADLSGLRAEVTSTRDEVKRLDARLERIAADVGRILSIVRRAPE